MKTLVSGLIDIRTLRARQGGLLLGLLMPALLLTAGVADARGGSLAIDGVVLGQDREQVEQRLGRGVDRGALGREGICWYRYGASSDKTTVSFTAQDRCVRIKGSSLELDGSRRMGLGDSRKEALEVLGEPLKAASRQGREVLEFEPAQRTTLYLVVEGGVVVQLSAAEI